MSPKMFLSPQTYNAIYSESSGIVITTKVLVEPTDHVKLQNKKLREQNAKMKRTLDYIVKYHSDHITGKLAQEALNGIP